MIYTRDVVSTLLVPIISKSGYDICFQNDTKDLITSFVTSQPLKHLCAWVESGTLHTKQKYQKASADTKQHPTKTISDKPVIPLTALLSTQQTPLITTDTIATAS